jgi:glutathione peroxidase
MKMLNGTEKSLSDYKGKVVLIVNVASKCGLTPQYKDLEATYKKYKDQGLVILGFPANNFLWQEPGEDSEIASFCQANYGVTFDMFSKISVKGSDMHPLYQFLTQKKYNKLEDASIKWNFQKFLIDKEGNIVKAISPKTKVTDSVVIADIEALLK